MENLYKIILSLFLFLSPYSITHVAAISPAVKVKAVRMVTSGEKNHFFGYYGINVWNKDKTHILSLETDFNDHLPGEGEKATIGLVNLRTHKFSPLTQTSAWNMQQGCMMFWNPVKPNEEFYFNDVVDGKLVSVLFNIKAKSRKVLPFPVSGISHDGKYAISLNYGRISRLRKVVSYSGTTDPNPTLAHPADDGLFVVNLQTNERKLIVSFAQMAEVIKKTRPDIQDKHMWNEHAEFSRGDNKILFLPRTWQADGKNLETGLFTVNVNGSDMKEILPYGSNVSHFGWRNDDEMVISYNFNGKSRSHVIVNCSGKPFIPLQGMGHDGHCSFDKTGEWVLTDGPRDMKKLQNRVQLIHVQTQQSFLVNSFEMVDPRFLGAGSGGNTRCDLHPRISNDNNMICVDAIDPKTSKRQIYIIDISIEKMD
jgi:hypothetical protein